ncbi:hypothetical protein LSH36_188g10003 [Paralvinella palmiformis]|uniref:Dolichol-phosphate mannosyltransferase subunit 3 n=1 Tax=Paralvinella palmiformis TaxID=53620 RepID=A0AAD9N5L6_9ANNE|nr:hypothetical protein LSH36_188g10003 [Paralvinella palmiformis]
MTKLLQWLTVLFLFLAVWLGLVTNHIPVVFSDAAKEVVYFLPIYLLMAFACYSLAVIGYRVTTFNDCVQAADELKQEIKEAKKDLTRKGFVFT